MDKSGAWSLAPAYDVCYAHNPNGAWTSGHQMSVNGKKTDMGRADLLAAGKVASLNARTCLGIFDNVQAAVRDWTRFAAEAEVRDSFVTAIDRRPNS